MKQVEHIEYVNEHYVDFVVRNAKQLADCIVMRQRATYNGIVGRLARKVNLIALRITESQIYFRSTKFRQNVCQRLTTYQHVGNDRAVEL